MRELDLCKSNRHDGGGAANGLGPHFGKTDGANLALVLELLGGANSDLDGHVGVHAGGTKDIDLLDGAEGGIALLPAGANFLGRALGHEGGGVEAGADESPQAERLEENDGIGGAFTRTGQEPSLHDAVNGAGKDEEMPSGNNTHLKSRMSSMGLISDAIGAIGGVGSLLSSGLPAAPGVSGLRDVIELGKSIAKEASIPPFFVGGDNVPGVRMKHGEPRLVLHRAPHPLTDQRFKKRGPSSRQRLRLSGFWESTGKTLLS